MTDNERNEFLAHANDPELRERLVREENARFTAFVSMAHAFSHGKTHEQMLADGWTMLTHSAGYGR